MEFKIGDRVKILINTTDYKIGDVGIISHIYINTYPHTVRYPISVRSKNNRWSVGFRKNELEHFFTDEQERLNRKYGVIK